MPQVLAIVPHCPLRCVQCGQATLYHTLPSTGTGTKSESLAASSEFVLHGQHTAAIVSTHTWPLMMSFHGSFCSCPLPLTPDRCGPSHLGRLDIRAWLLRSGMLLLPLAAISAACSQAARLRQASAAAGMGRADQPAVESPCGIDRNDMLVRLQGLMTKWQVKLDASDVLLGHCLRPVSPPFDRSVSSLDVGPEVDTVMTNARAQ
jgi:hypothetical protein